MSLFKIFNKSKTLKKESVEIIKEFFIYHHGDGMSMHRDDPEKYKQYRTLEEDIIEQWRQELIIEDFESLASNAENTWLTVGRLIRLISASRNNVEKNFKRLLIQISDITPVLDKKQKILILEHFAGRTLSQEDGGIYIIQSKSNLNELLKIAINTLSDFTCTVSDNTSEVGWENIQQRYENVNKAIESALTKFEIN